MKGSRVYLRIEEETKEKWVIAAKKRGLTLSDYVRTLVDPGEIGVEASTTVSKTVNTGLSPISPVSKRGKKELPSQEVKGFKTYFK